MSNKISDKLCGDYYAGFLATCVEIFSKRAISGFLEKDLSTYIYTYIYTCIYIKFDQSAVVSI